MNDIELLSNYRNSLKIAWGFNDYSDWPIKVTSIMHLFVGELTTELVRDIDYIYEQSNGSQKLGELFIYPGRIFRLIDVVQFGLRINRVKLESQRETVVKLIKGAIGLKQSDLFSLNMTNLLIGNNLNQYTLTKDINHDVINQFHAALFLYCESVFFRGHDAGKAIHGPYRSNNGHLLVREYYNLKDNPLWPDEYKVSFNKITTICEYSDDVTIGIDLYDHLSYKGSIKNNLINSCILIDNLLINDSDQIRQCTKDILKKSNKIQNAIKNWDWKLIAKQYANIFWFRTKPIKNYLNKESTPPESIYKKIQNGNINDIRLKNLSPKEVALLIQLGV